MRWTAAGVLALVLAACIHFDGHSVKGGHCVVIRQFPSERVLAKYPQPKDGRFILSFIHSVSGTPVQDEYRIVVDRIVQTAERYQAHGAGLPSGTDEPGVTEWYHQEGWFVIQMERPISRLIVRTDRNYRNRLRLDGSEINLNGWPDQALELVVVPCSEMSSCTTSVSAAR